MPDSSYYRFRKLLLLNGFSFLCLLSFIMSTDIVYAGSTAEDTTVYLIEHNGKNTGKEKAVITDKKNTSTVSSTVNFSITHQQNHLQSDFKADLMLDENGRPTGYTLKGRMNNQPVDFGVTFKDNSAIAGGHSVSVHSDTLVVLDNLVTAHYEILLRRFFSAQTKTYQFHAFIPQAMAELPATITHKGEFQGRSGGETIGLKRFGVNLGAIYIEVWADKNDRLVRVMVPAQKIMFTREDLTGLAEITEQVESEDNSSVIEDEVEFKSGDVALSGAIRRPVEIDGKRPGILFLSGSGPQDRDGKSPDRSIDLQTGRILSHLVLAGNIVLSFDDRGVGTSKNCCKNITFQDEVQDAAAALAFLSNHKMVDSRRIFLIGHSSGAITASKLAERYHNIAGICFMAPPGRPLKDIIMNQVQNMMKLQNIPENQQKAEIQKQEHYFNFIRKYQPGEEIPPALQPQKSGLLWMKELLDHDPQEDYARLTCPVLILHGKKDFQVSEADAEKIVENLKSKGNPDVRMKIYPNLDHFFMPASNKNVADYYDRNRTVSPEFLTDLTKWISAQS